MHTTITAVCDLATQVWEVRSDLQPSSDTLLKVGFRRGEQTQLTFNDLSFGVKITRTTDPSEEDVILLTALPRKNQAILSSTEEIIYTENVILDMGDNFDIEFTATEGGATCKHLIETVIPLPEQPHASWRWDGQKWYPPGAFPMPPEGDDPTAYEWSEETQGWVKNVRDPEEVWDLPERV